MGAMLVLACAQAQPPPDLRLPKSVHMAGVVVDAEGKPVDGASIDDSGDMREIHQTDSEGRFALDTGAPAIVIRKGGFRSETVRTREATEVRIVLKRAFPICTNSVRYVGIEGPYASFQFPKIQGVEISAQVNDVDYSARYYYVNTKHKRKAIMHGSGVLWGAGTPSDADVSQSVKYEETRYDADGITILDARGQFANGDRWRCLGKFGESASYSDVDEATAKLLDQVLDGACIKPVTPHPRAGQ